jgi:hypothetical protein
MNESHIDQLNSEPFESELSVTQLLLDIENFRIEEVDSQRDAIKALFEVQDNGEKILNLARHIVEHETLAPGERIYVIPDDIGPQGQDEAEGCFVVMDGNRRVAALKVLESPNLVQDYFPRIYREFMKLSEKVPSHLLTMVPCVVMPNRDAALEWVEVRHSTNLEGVGLEKWDAVATARFDEQKGKYRRWLIAVGRLQQAGIDVSEIQKGIRGKTTAVDRVLNAGAIRSDLGLRFRNSLGTVEFENGDEQQGIELLRDLMTAMANDRFRTENVHSLDDRNQFISRFAQRSSQHHASLPNTTSSNPTDSPQETGPEGGGSSKTSHSSADPVREESQEGAEAKKRSEGTRSTGKHPRPPRRTLAPKDRTQTFHVHDEALRSIYTETRNMRVDEFPRSCLILTRTFVELSCDSYLAHKKVPVPAHVSKRGKGNWIDASLRQKVEAVTISMDPNKSIRDLDQVRKILGSDDWLHSIDSLHDWVHNRMATITAEEARTIWDRYQPFLMKLHDEIERAVS